MVKIPQKRQQKSGQTINHPSTRVENPEEIGWDNEPARAETVRKLADNFGASSGNPGQRKLKGEPPRMEQST